MTGVAATTDREAILSLGADCVVYMPRATGTGPSRAGLTQAELLDDIVPLLEAGTNIVTTCTDLFARGVRLGEEGRSRCAARLREGAVVGVGVGQRPRVHHRERMSAPRRYPRDVITAEPEAGDRAAGLAPTPAKARIVSAAVALFAEHGVGGTSLQMIATAIGVTKAAVYHQFKTKEEIVIAAAEAELARLEAAMDAAEAEPNPELARDALLVRIVSLAVERRRMESTLAGDPVLVRYFAHHEPFQRVMDRLYRMLAGDDSGTEGRTRAAMLSAAIGGAVMHPLVANLDDETLRTQLLLLARRFLDVPG